MRPSEMPGERTSVLPWPYIEGLRMDEAMHPLTLMVVGLYGKVLPNQNGAPLRVHMPWKYGFKSGKSIVRIRLHRQAAAEHVGGGHAERVRLLRQREPERAASALEPGARSRGCPELFKNRPTLMFNGYADQVASLYAGMDLKKNF